MECKYLGVDIQDEHGRHEVGYMENTKKDPINGGAGKWKPKHEPNSNVSRIT